MIKAMISPTQTKMLVVVAGIAFITSIVYLYSFSLTPIEPEVGRLDVGTYNNTITNPSSTSKQVTTSSSTVPSVTSGITGTVMLGPTCPVMQDPPEPGCAEKPFETRLALTSSDGAQVIKEFNSDKNGLFTLDTPPGTYSIRQAAAANILPYCSYDSVVVTKGAYTSIIVSCDSGIR